MIVVRKYLQYQKQKKKKIKMTTNTPEKMASLILEEEAKVWS